MGQSEEAGRLYRQGLAIAQSLTRAEPANTTFQRDLSVSYNKLADLAVQTGQSEEAERLYRQGLAIHQNLARAEPANTTFQRGLSVSYERLVAFSETAGKATVLLRQALQVRRTLWRQELAASTLPKSSASPCFSSRRQTRILTCTEWSSRFRSHSRWLNWVTPSGRRS